MRPLTYILLFVLLTCVFTMVGAVTVTGPRSIELSESEAETCAREGGCVLVTSDAITNLVNQIDKLERQLKAEKSKLCV